MTPRDTPAPGPVPPPTSVDTWRSPYISLENSPSPMPPALPEPLSPPAPSPPSPPSLTPNPNPRTSRTSMTPSTDMMSSTFTITPFNGDKKNYRTFVHQLNILFIVEAAKFDMPIKKILFALNQMKGGYAEEWANMVVERYLSDTTTLGTWEVFKARLDVEFADVTEKESTYIELGKLWQKGMTVPEFFTKFNYLIGKAGLSADRHNNLLMTLLEPALDYNIMDQIYAGSHLPTTYASWKQKAIDIGGMLQR